MKSILQEERECYICGNPRVEEHHIFGAYNRPLSEQYGLKVWLCPLHHREVHAGGYWMDELHRLGESAFIRAHNADRDAFAAVFGRNYL